MLLALVLKSLAIGLVYYTIALTINVNIELIDTLVNHVSQAQQ